MAKIMSRIVGTSILFFFSSKKPSKFRDYVNSNYPESKRVCDKIENFVSNYTNLLFFFTHCRFGRERSDDPVRVHLKEVSGPTDLRIRTDLHPFLAMPHLLPVKVHVAKVENAGQNFENRVLFLRSESQHLHGRQQRFEVLGIGLPIDLAVSTLNESRGLVYQRGCTEIFSKIL